MSDQTITIRLMKDGDDWWTSQIVEHPAAISEGSNEYNAAANVLDALFDVLEAEVSGADRGTA